MKTARKAIIAGIGIFQIQNIILSARLILMMNYLIFYGRKKEQQEAAKAYFRERYTQYFADEHKRINTTGNGKPINLICVRENGTYITPRTLHHTSAVIHNQLSIPEFDYHSLRHTHTTMLIESGAPIKYVQARLGHKNIDITFNIYQHLTENQKAQGNAILNQMFSQ